MYETLGLLQAVGIGFAFIVVVILALFIASSYSAPSRSSRSMSGV